MPFPRPEAAALQAAAFGNQVSFTVEVRMMHGAETLGQHPGDTIALPAEDAQGEVRAKKPLPAPTSARPPSRTPQADRLFQGGGDDAGRGCRRWSYPSRA